MSFSKNIDRFSSLDLNGLQNKKVLLRIDVNLPLTTEGDIDFSADWRLRAVLPTIQRLQQRGVTIILLGHLGRPGGVVDSSLSLAPITNRLSEMLRKKVVFVSSVFGPDVDVAVRDIGDDILMLENLRFEPGEEANDPLFAERLASFGDFYINDAFATSHREHSSIVGLPKILPSIMGPLFEKEVTVFNEFLSNTSHPLVLLLGGAKIATKAPVVQRFMDIADTIILLGALANSILAARGISVGVSLVENVPAEIVQNESLLLPSDVVSASSLEDRGGSIVEVSNIPKDALAVDIGPQTIAEVRKIIEGASAVVWNGPIGFVENVAFAAGTRALADILVASSAKVVVGGGDTVGYLQKQGLLDSFAHVSTGGGSMLEYLASGTLPGIKALQSSLL